MQEIVDQDSIITVSPREDVKYIVKFGQIGVDPPRTIEDRKMYPLTPMDARNRDLNYDGAIHCDITTICIEGKHKKIREFPRTVIGRMPLMLKSVGCVLRDATTRSLIDFGEDPNDPGGYFIIKGIERVLVGQLRANYNQIFVKKDWKEKISLRSSRKKYVRRNGTLRKSSSSYRS